MNGHHTDVKNSKVVEQQNKYLGGNHQESHSTHVVVEIKSTENAKNT